MTTKSGELESRDYLISGQCGFSFTKEGNSLTESQQWARLALLAETAAESWPDARAVPAGPARL